MLTLETPLQNFLPAPLHEVYWCIYVDLQYSFEMEVASRSLAKGRPHYLGEWVNAK